MNYITPCTINCLEDFDELKAKYTDVKDPTWPEIESFDDFTALPRTIQDECIDIYSVNVPEWYPNLHNTDILITFGCSWMFGTGAMWSEEIPSEEYYKIRNQPDMAFPASFRGLISTSFNMINLNFAIGGSGNQRNFRLCIEHFSSPLFQDVISKARNVIVLWSITSTARNELWDAIEDRYANIKYGATDNTSFQQSYIKHTYNHTEEVKRISENIFLYNKLFSSFNIPVLWFDAFNTHTYPVITDNMLADDLLTLLSGVKTYNNEYHLNIDGIIDDSRIKGLILDGYLNHYDLHPTKLGHLKIYNILEPHIQKMLTSVG